MLPWTEACAFKLPIMMLKLTARCFEMPFMGASLTFQAVVCHVQDDITWRACKAAAFARDYDIDAYLFKGDCSAQVWDFDSCTHTKKNGGG